MPGQPFAGRGEDTPASTAVGGEGDGGVFRAVGESKEREGLERAVEQHGARREAGDARPGASDSNVAPHVSAGKCRRVCD